MKLFYSVLLLLVTASLIYAQLYIGRVQYSNLEDKNMIEANCVSIIHDEIPGILDIVGSLNDVSLLQDAGFEVLDIRPFQETGLDEIDPEYHTYEEYIETLQQYALDFPGLCKLDSIGHAQQFPRTIWCMKVSDSPEVEEDEIAILYIGVHHACEVMGGETLLYMIGHLLDRYGTDPEITFWVDNYEIFFVPLLNPDGNYAVTEGINDFWRKNARDIDQDSVYYEFIGGTWWSDDHEGIDLNRNYDWYWANGGTGVPWSYYYRGDDPFSEAETQAIRALAEEQHFVEAISFHSYGEVVIYPWTINLVHSPDDDIIEVMAAELASGFQKDNFDAYDSSLGYGDSGQCRNWLYGAKGCIGFCVELLPYPTFIAPGEELSWRTERYFQGAKYILERASGSGITGHITDIVTGEPIYARVEITDRISNSVNPRYNEPLHGRYTRLLNAGAYGVSVSAQGYNSTVVWTTVSFDTITCLDIELTPQTIVEDIDIPVTQILDVKCSPNPFNNNLTIEYSVPKSSLVTLNIYDCTGRTVYQKTVENNPANLNQFHWNASAEASGIYFVQITAGTDKNVQKVILLK